MRRHEMSHALSSTTPTESDFMEASRKETNGIITQIDLGIDGLTPSGVCHDQGNCFASPQTQDFLTLFQQPMSYEFECRLDTGCHSRDRIDSSRMV